MKSKSLRVLAIHFFLVTYSFVSAQDEPKASDLPGGNFSLYGALEMFKKASSIEEFETLINEHDNAINNLDLNDNGEVDYVRVIDNQEKEAHAFVLQVAVSESENQDIAIIELEKTGKEEAILQIVGDEDIYGENIIVEASDGSEEILEEVAPNRKGPCNYRQSKNAFIIVNVWSWPTVRFVYAPSYRPWISPWYWRHYPVWYKPWRPLTWSVYHPLRSRYHHAGYRTVQTHRVVVAHRVYTPHRVTSVTVKTKHSKSLETYRATRTTKRTTIIGPKGNSHTVKKSTITIKSKGSTKKVRGNAPRKGN